MLNYVLVLRFKEKTSFQFDYIPFKLKIYSLVF